MSGQNKARIKLGESCINYFFVVNIAVFVTPFIQGTSVSLQTQLLFGIGSLVMLRYGVYLLEDTQPKPLSGKWKRIKVKKDTTIHIQEQED